MVRQAIRIGGHIRCNVLCPFCAWSGGKGVKAGVAWRRTGMDHGTAPVRRHQSCGCMQAGLMRRLGVHAEDAWRRKWSHTSYDCCCRHSPFCMRSCPPCAATDDSSNQGANPKFENLVVHVQGDSPSTKLRLTSPARTRLRERRAARRRSWKRVWVHGGQPRGACLWLAGGRYNPQSIKAPYHLLLGKLILVGVLNVLRNGTDSQTTVLIEQWCPAVGQANNTHVWSKSAT